MLYEEYIFDSYQIVQYLKLENSSFDEHLTLSLVSHRHLPSTHLLNSAKVVKLYSTDIL